MSNRLFTYIKEVIIEKFMSYEYARINFVPGINFVVGPNGAGKSSILLAISIAMGQIHTERGRKLSDLIRRGEDIARVSIIFDNSLKGGRRPFPYIRTDEVKITRILRRDGHYWFEINNRYVSRLEVERILSKIGIDPDNILIIMHQNMIESFGWIDSREKLILFEEALGLKEYRDRILNIRERLEKIGGEEAEIRKYLSNAELALKEWKEEYEKWLEKKRLMERIKRLEAELAWKKYYNILEDIYRIEKEIDRLNDELRDLDTDLIVVKRNLRELNEAFEEIKEGLIVYIDDLYAKLLDGVKIKYRETIEEYISKIEKNRLEYGRAKATETLYLYRIDELRSKLKTLDEEFRKLRSSLKVVESEAKTYGEPIESDRSIQEIQGELRDLKSRLKLYEDVDENAEYTYEYYKRLYEDLKVKMEKIIEDKKALEEELKARISKWKKEVSYYVSEVSKLFNEFLSGLNASGYVRVENIDDIDEAKLELYVGFGGMDPIRLDAFSQSGGERTAAAMAFLLSLQRYIKSPFRAIDEFDVHMDPKNREAILNYLVETIKREGGQYVIITPGLISKVDKGANVIIVQKVEGVSIPTEVKTIDQ